MDKLSAFKTPRLRIVLIAWIILSVTTPFMDTPLKSPAIAKAAHNNPGVISLNYSFQQDSDDPELLIVRTGVSWDPITGEYTSNEKDWLQVIFKDASNLDPGTIDADNFVVEGQSVTGVQWFDVDPEQMNGGPGSTDPHPDGPKDFDGVRKFTCSFSGVISRCDLPGSQILRPASWVNQPQSFIRPETNAFAMIRNMVFLQIEDELETDETPRVNIVPSGLDDVFGNTLDTDDIVASDFISPEITILQVSSPLPPNSVFHHVLGEDDSIEMIVTTSEDLKEDPQADARFVHASPGCVARDDCLYDIGVRAQIDVDEIGRNRWRVEINPQFFLVATGYYNIFFQATDENGNVGELGINPNDISKSFYTSEGQVREDGAIFLERDVLLPKPRVTPSDGDILTFEDPFLITVDFTTPFDPMSVDPRENLTEGEEYSGDTFDQIVVTQFSLDGLNFTDLVSLVRPGVFEISLDNLSLGKHEITVDAVDQALNSLVKPLQVEFEVIAREDPPTPTPVPPTLTPTFTMTPVPPTLTPTSATTPVPPTLTATFTKTPVPPTPQPTPTPTPSGGGGCSAPTGNSSVLNVEWLLLGLVLPGLGLVRRRRWMASIPGRQLRHR